MDMAKLLTRTIFAYSIKTWNKKRRKEEKHKREKKIRKSTGDITMIINGKKIKAKDLAKQG